ncbi:uncharacterized protein MELLADRAFT_94675 [Melampsora larici-populina 98AG31]|uniref:Uncharacterized protein n=1 Tax=Melampsora larici-populina (strain 98AG31 / pathotype 3-4-7) TaxID=747676 RepID=F4S7J6_MELLP|nr:uncharacterized protein MELLADRAFT_94675 [Melampsora larici-populina 98AG31]EGF99381.1 hypothetical protein MELLADRAFT_94675 [Melampsora larici-populina 98AG31]
MPSEPTLPTRVLRDRKKATSNLLPAIQESSFQNVVEGSENSMKRKRTSAGSDTGSVTHELRDDIPQRLKSVGVTVGEKSSRVRLLELLDKCTKPKRPRLRESSASRIPSAHEVRVKSKSSNKQEKVPVPDFSDVSLKAQQSSALSKDRPAPSDHDFNCHEPFELIQMIKNIGLDGQGLTKDELVGLCNDYRDLTVVIPRHFFRFALPEPLSPSTSRLEGSPDESAAHQPPSQWCKTSSRQDPTQATVYTGTSEIPSKSRRKGKEKANIETSNLTSSDVSLAAEQEISVDSSSEVRGNDKLENTQISDPASIKLQSNQPEKHKTRDPVPSSRHGKIFEKYSPVDTPSLGYQSSSKSSHCSTRKSMSKNLRPRSKRKKATLIWEDEASQHDETPSDRSNYSDDLMLETDDEDLMLETDEEDQPELPTRKQKTRPHKSTHPSTPLNSSSVPLTPTPHRDKPSVAGQSDCEESTHQQEWRPKYWTYMWTYTNRST